MGGWAPLPNRPNLGCSVVAGGDPPTLLQLWEECHVILLLDGSLCGVCPVRATAELSSPKPVTTMTQSTTTCSHGAEWNLLSYQAGLGLVTDQDRSSSLLPAPPFFCLFV